MRRVSATEGDELVDAVNANVYVVPKDHAWVTADADAMGEDGGRVRHEDSRTFGPVEARASSGASCTRFEARPITARWRTVPGRSSRTRP